MKRTLSNATLTELTARELKLAELELHKRNLPYTVNNNGALLFNITIEASLTLKAWDEIIDACWNNILIRELLIDVVFSLTPDELRYVADRISHWDEEFQDGTPKVNTPREIIDVLADKPSRMPDGIEDEREYFLQVFGIDAKNR